MSEKLTFESVQELMKNKMDLTLWSYIELDREAIRAEVRKEVTEEILREHFKRGERVTWGEKMTGTVVILDDRPRGDEKWTHDGNAFLVDVHRIPKTRPMTREEKIEAFKSRGIFPNLWNSWELFKDQTIDDLCHAAGIKTEVTE